MEWQKENSNRMKEQAEEGLVILLRNWKKRQRRQRIYRILLSVILSISCMALTGMVYYYIDCSIPSVINVRAGQEESFHLGVPATGEIVSVSGQK